MNRETSSTFTLMKLTDYTEGIFTTVPTTTTGVWVLTVIALGHLQGAFQVPSPRILVPPEPC